MLLVNQILAFSLNSFWIYHPTGGIIFLYKNDQLVIFSSEVYKLNLSQISFKKTGVAVMFLGLILAAALFLTLYQNELTQAEKGELWLPQYC